MVCSKCGGKGTYISSLGIEVKCTCGIGENVNKVSSLNKEDKKNINNSVGVLRNAIEDGIVPECYKDSKFDMDLMEFNIKSYASALKCNVYNLDGYKMALSSIAEQVRNGKLKKSYMLCVSNGFSKGTFINNLIMESYEKGYNVVPYISAYELSELGYISNIGMRKIYGANNIKNQDGEDIDDEGRLFYEKMRNSYKEYKYVYHDFINADVLFIKMSTPAFANIESSAINTILSIRSLKGLGTVVVCEYALRSILSQDKRDRSSNKLLREHLIDNMTVSNFESYKGIIGTDKMLYVPCYCAK